MEFFDPKKAAQEKDVYTNIFKQSPDFFAFHVQKDINASIYTSKADVIPVQEKI